MICSNIKYEIEIILSMIQGFTKHCLAYFEDICTMKSHFSGVFKEIKNYFQF